MSVKSNQNKPNFKPFLNIQFGDKDLPIDSKIPINDFYANKFTFNIEADKDSLLLKNTKAFEFFLEQLYDKHLDTILNRKNSTKNSEHIFTINYTKPDTTEIPINIKITLDYNLNNLISTKKNESDKIKIKDSAKKIIIPKLVTEYNKKSPYTYLSSVKNSGDGFVDFSDIKNFIKENSNHFFTLISNYLAHSDCDKEFQLEWGNKNLTSLLTIENKKIESIINKSLKTIYPVKSELSVYLKNNKLNYTSKQFIKADDLNNSMKTQTLKNI